MLLPTAAKQTKYRKVNTGFLEHDVLREAAEILRSGGLVAFPTETVYGLGANAYDANAVSAIFKAKGRPQDNPLIVHLAKSDDVPALTTGELPEQAEKLMRAFWPGPLTLILPRGKAVPLEVTAGLDTVAVRVPAHPVALALIEEAGVPVAAPSANLSGRPSPTNAGHVYKDLNGRIDLILDGGPAGVGVESTVLDLTGHVPVILRPGGVTVEELRDLLGEVEADPRIFVDGGDGCDIPRSPGMKYKHYAPNARVVLVEGERSGVVARIRSMTLDCLKKGRRTGILAPVESACFYSDIALGHIHYQNSSQKDAGKPAACLVTFGSREDPSGIASMLFSCLRLFDELQVEIICVEGIEPRGLGLAVMNRLRRAADRYVTVGTAE